MRRSRVAIICLVLLLGSILAVVGSIYLIPYTVVEIPSACEAATLSGQGSSPVPSRIDNIDPLGGGGSTAGVLLQRADPDYPVPVVGDGILLAEDSGSAVVAVVSNDTTFSSSVYLVDMVTEKVLWSMSFAGDTLVAGFGGGTAYVYYSGLGYEVNAATGAPVGDIIKLDNYRAVYEAGGATYIQTDAFIAEVNAGRGLVTHTDLKFEGLAFDCLVP
jgi:hypothetical protein